MSSTKTLSKGVRLRTLKDFQRVYQSPQKFRKKGFLVLTSPNDLQVARLGISISKKKIARAVDRNRLKRLIRESFRLNRLDLPHIDLIVIFSADNFDDLTRDEISKNLDALWLDLIAYYKKPC